MSYSFSLRPTIKRICFLFKIYQLLIIFIALLSCEKKPHPLYYFPEIGKKALHQRSLDLKSNLNVLSIAIQPGKEDLAGLAYFRMAKGATIVSAYVTNGESGESDIKAEYPAFLAGIRRQEASQAISFLDGETHFLNMPGIASARDTVKVRNLWQSDTLQTRLKRLIIRFRPNIILVAPDWTTEKENPLQEILYKNIIKVVNNVSTKGSNKNITGTDSDEYWDVNRVFAADFKKNDFSINYDLKHPKWKKTYRKISEEAALKYRSLKIQRSLWLKSGDPSYHLIYYADAQNINEIDEGLLKTDIPRFRSIEYKIERLCDSIIKGKTKGALKKLVAIKDSINIFLMQRKTFDAGEREALFDWNLDIENLRCTLLGVEVKYRISDTKLAPVQITYLTIDQVKGIRDEGKTEIFFSGTDQGWIINESRKRQLPLKLHEQYRLVSPKNVNFHFPYGHQKIQSASEGAPYFFFIIHNTAKKEHSFIYRARIDFSFGPVFVTEVLTPIVRMIPGERVIVRLTNTSRDGVRDTVKVEDPLASSTESVFRLRSKGSSHLDTLLITWKGNPRVGSYLVPVRIGEAPLANFVVRKFHAEVDTSKKIGIIPGLRNSPIENALHRLDMRFSTVELGRTFSQQIESLDVLIVDRRVLTLKPRIENFVSEMDNFVNRGGHLLVLAQDAASWNTKPLWDGMHLTPTLRLDETIPLQVDSTHTLLTSPNFIGRQDWNDWLFLRGYNDVFCSTLEGVQFPIRVSKEDLPLIVIQKKGNGRRTYVDLALGQQWMNIHPGAFRLLANLISY